MFGSKRRQEIYDRVRSSSKREVILEEMIRHGFWPEAGNMPNDPADEIRRQSDLRKELASLRTEQTRLKNTEAMLRQVKKQRMAESKQRQKETKERKERERIERAEAWKLKQSREIGYLGEKVSGGLSSYEGDNARLEAQGLPIFAAAIDIAKAIGIKLETLRFLSYNREVSTVSNYVRFEIAKKTGGTRRISAPLPTLKYAQEWVLRNILDKLPISDVAHGFCAGRSIVTNAAPHVGADIVINVDLKDFFPTLTYKRVKGIFRNLGYNETSATILGLLCTEPDTEVIDMDGKTYYVATGERHLPQGAPSSPMITNVICRRLDKKLTAICEKHGFTYTRYADDLTFSASKDKDHLVGKLLRQLRFLVKKEGFQINEKKTRILRSSQCQEVTGIVVNEKMSVSRKRLKAFRAVLHHIEKDGPEGKIWGSCGNVLNSIWGFANFVAMVDKEKGLPLQIRVWKILEQNGWQRPAITDHVSSLPSVVPGTIVADRLALEAAKAKPLEIPPVPSSEKKSATPPPLPKQVKEEKKKPWWKFW